jgi:acyl transferase domain-containing protein
MLLTKITETLIRSVYKNAGINPKDTGYVEAHGTGTKVGDPIEVTALRNVFGEDRSAKHPLFIGSVKSNVGHLEAASGMYWQAVNLVKTALTLQIRYHIGHKDSNDA